MQRCRARWPRLSRWLAELLEAGPSPTLTILDKPVRRLARGALDPGIEEIARLVEPGHRLGPWRLLEKVGEGGMGVVYRAERADGSFRKTVAVKLLRLRGSGLGEQLQRESHLLARLDHPAVTRLIDAGLDDRAGPYLVMEWVEGIDLPTWIEGAPSLDERLDVLIALCEAVSHAHQHLIVHGDIKPANVRLHQDGQVNLLDFGVARLFDERDPEDHPGAGLTPSFAPPEQLLGQPLRPHGDIWALGAVLGWMVEGRIPGRNDGPPSSAPVPEPDRPGELRAIVDKACAFEPEDRYSSVDGLAADLRRYQGHWPVEAHQPSRFSRAWKFLRRNPVLTGGVATSLTLLAIGLVVSLLLYSQASQRALELEQLVSFQQAQLADIEVADMGAALRESLVAQREALLEESGGGHESEGGYETPDLGLEGINFTDVALDVLEAFIFAHSLATIEKQFSDQPDYRARMLQAVATTMREIGLIDAAREPQRQALELFKTTRGKDHPKTLSALYQRGLVARDSGDYEKARSYLEAALERQERVLGSRHLDTLDTRNSMASIHTRAGDLDLAEENYRAALNGRRDQLGDHHRKTLASVHNLGIILRMRGDPEQGMEYARMALEGFRESLGENHQATLGAKSGLSSMLRALDRPDEALKYSKKALDGRRDLLGSRHPDTLNSISNTGMLIASIGDLEKALPYYVEALEGRRVVLGPDHNSTLASMTNLGVLKRRMGKLDAAEKLQQQAFERRHGIYGPDSPGTLASLNNLARVLEEKGSYDQARNLYAQVVERSSRVLGPDHVRTLSTTNRLGTVTRRLGKLEESRAILATAVEASQTRWPNGNWRTGYYLANLGKTLHAKEHHRLAEARLLLAFSILESELGLDDERTMDASMALTRVYVQ